MTVSRLSIRIVLADGSKLGPAKIALLEAIHAQGSISGAARAIGLDKIKIDRSFVDNMEREPEAFALVRALLGFGRGLGLTVTAEGVEKPAQAIALQREGCQQAQGYLYSRAVSANDAMDFIRKHEKEVTHAQAHVP